MTRPVATRLMRWTIVGTAVFGVSGCSEVGTDPATAAAIELAPFPATAVVIGDTLRAEDGTVAPIRAIVFNVRGNVITDFPVRYLYPDFNRDSALLVDSATGVIVAVRQPAGEARLAARAGGTLQVLRSLFVVQRPDTLSGQSLSTVLQVAPPDSGRGRNTTTDLTATVRHIAPDSMRSPVRGWLVRYTLISPANPGNDTTAAAFLVDDTGRPSTVDTTDVQGNARRRVRVRSLLFPQGGAVDSVVVAASASYNRIPLRGSPVRIAAPVQRAAVP